jgi:hypothetical protein
MFSDPHVFPARNAPGDPLSLRTRGVRRAIIRTRKVFI